MLTSCDQNLGRLFIGPSFHLRDDFCLMGDKLVDLREHVREVLTSVQGLFEGRNLVCDTRKGFTARSHCEVSEKRSERDF